jgi:signal transduction histidine kinase
VTLGARRVGEEIELVVADHGPGIASADRARVLGRFVRLEGARSRPGSGLGLSLAAAVARMHGGAVRLEDNAPGLRVVLALPGRPAALPQPVIPRLEPPR